MDNNVEVERIVLNIMLSILVALAFWYVFILGSMVFNIVERSALQKSALTLSNDVGSLELSYLSVSSNVNMALSSSMGYKETKVTFFATRKALGLGLTPGLLPGVKSDKNEI